MEAGLDGLTLEILEAIAGELTEAADLGSLARVSRLFARVLRSGHVWRAALALASDGSRCRDGCARRTLKQIATLSCARWRTAAGAQGAPCARTGAATFACDGGRTLVVFGGSARWFGLERILSDCFACEVATGRWYVAAPAQAGPSARTFMADGGGGAVLRDAQGAEFLVLHGGLLSSGQRTSETFLLGPLGAARGAARWQWSQLAHNQEARLHHCFTVMGAECRGRPRQADPSGSALVISGGHNYLLRPILAVHVLSLRGVDLCVGEEAALLGGGRVSEAALRALCWKPADELPPLRPAPGSEPCPRARAHHSAAAWGRRLVLFGGELEDGTRGSDTWLLDSVLGGWTRLPVSLPTGGRARAAAAVSGDCLLICGGEGPDAVAYADVWALDLSAPTALGWTLAYDCFNSLRQVDRLGAPLGLSASLAPIHAGRTLLLFGGHSGEGIEDHLGDPASEFYAPTYTCAFRLARRGGAAPAVVLAARCELGRDDEPPPMSRDWQMGYALSGDRLLACYTHEAEGRMVVSVLGFTEDEVLAADELRPAEEHQQ